MSLFKDKVELGIEEVEFETQKALGGLSPLIRLMVIILAIGIIPAFYIAKNLGYKIWQTRLNQGALFAKASFTNPTPPKVTPVNLSLMTNSSYAASVNITNENLELSLENAPYEFNFYNAQKQTLYTYSGKLFLLPNQSKYIIVPKFDSPENPAFADFKFTDTLNWQRRLNLPQVKIQTSVPNLSQQASPPAFVVQGDFFNNSPYKLKSVNLTFVLMDFREQILGVSSRQEFTINPFERRTYTQLWPNMSGGNVYKVEVNADTDTLDPTNLTASTASSGASSLGR